MAPMLIEIHGWLKKPEPWRFLGFASAVVGLLCYALSSSFHYLFREWNLLKILVYSVFSLIICLLILFVKLWKDNKGIQRKAHMVFIVLTITSVYSFFFDRAAANGKPDAYSIVSCTAFAIMSLSLSRQIHWEFEVDLLHFFLSGLIVQLMKINLLLALVGVGFSYAIIILRSSLDDEPETGNLELPDPHHLVIHVDSQQSNAGMQQEGNTHNQVLMTHVDSHSQEVNPGSVLIIPKFMACIKALESENRRLTILLCDHVEKYLESDVDSKDTNQFPAQKDLHFMEDVLPLEIINDLNQWARVMVAAGLEVKCCHMYSSCRREFLEQCLSILGLQDHNEGQPGFSIESWIKASNITFKILFPHERTLCHRVFSGLPSTADLSFKEVCSVLTNRLLNFVNSLAIGSHPPNLLRNTLCVLKTLGDLIPEFESLFYDQYSASLRDEAITVYERLGEATCKGISMGLENQIPPDTDQAPEYIPSLETIETLPGLNLVKLKNFSYQRMNLRSLRYLRFLDLRGGTIESFPKQGWEYLLSLQTLLVRSSYQGMKSLLNGIRHTPLAKFSIEVLPNPDEMDELDIIMRKKK